MKMKTWESSNNSCSDNNKPMDFSGVYSQAAQANGRVPVRFRKHGLDSGNSVMSFDSVQTEPAYSKYNNHCNKLYSSSSSKSIYSVSNISECISEIPPMVVEQPSIDEENIQYWANNINNSPIKGQIEVKGHNDYLSRRSQVYPENLQTYNGYDIVQASLVLTFSYKFEFFMNSLFYNIISNLSICTKQNFGLDQEFLLAHLPCCTRPTVRQRRTIHLPSPVFSK